MRSRVHVFPHPGYWPGDDQKPHGPATTSSFFSLWTKQTDTSQRDFVKYFVAVSEKNN